MTTYDQRIKQFKTRFRIGANFKRDGHPPSRRSYPAGGTDRLLQDWMTATATGDAEIRFDIQNLRDRSRQLERADPLMRRYLSCLQKNVLKSGVGFNLQNKATNPDGTPDFMANRKIEMAFKEWSKKKNCSENGESSLYEVCRLTLRSAARDGGVMLRKIIHPKVNAFGFALRLIEIDHLDINYNAWNGENRIVMGVEKNAFGKTVAYWMLRQHPGDLLFGSSPYNRERIPADDIIHYFIKERVTQCVGVPWAAPSMIRMHHLEQYEISEIVASRKASNKGGYFVSDRGDDYAGEKEETTASDGTVTETGTFNDSEPGQDDQLPAGMSFVPYNPTHPTSQYGDFTRDAKLGIATGMDMSYATLVGDLTKSSFSSMRTGWLDERETYKQLQAHMIENLMNEVFEVWLETAITTGAINLPMSKFDQFNQPNFEGRKWAWIDPVKDVTAKIMELGAGLTTREAVICESDSSTDLEDTFAQLEYEQDLAKKHGLDFSASTPMSEEKMALQQSAEEDGQSPDQTEKPKPQK